ncbi:hypothetical protein H101_03012 [Trichophyton interdigitale H6]|nr:hypothetical protein H101_03012 [Trichophyton interdigitale H6]
MKSSVTQDIEPQEVTIANTAFREQLDLIPLPSASRQSRLGDPQTNENLRRADHAWKLPDIEDSSNGILKGSVIHFGGISSQHVQDAMIYTPTVVFHNRA